MQPWEETPSERARSQILEMLYESSEPVSGRVLSERLGVGRNSVWKHIQALREMGYEIAGKTRQGYWLVSIPDVPYAFEVKRDLDTHTLGKEVLFLPTAGSTNDLVRELAKIGAPTGLAVVADTQVSGRGRRGRSWESPIGGGLWFSVLLHPQQGPERAPLMTVLAGVAVSQAIRQLTGLPATVKWPNDVRIKGRKVCGILVEMTVEGSRIQHLVVGIGLNVNLPKEQWPPDLRNSMTSILAEQGEPAPRVELMRSILHELEWRYDQMEKEGPQAILAENRQVSDVLGKQIDIFSDTERWRGEALAIEDDGALRVRLLDGQERVFYAGEVSVRR